MRSRREEEAGVDRLQAGRRRALRRRDAGSTKLDGFKPADRKQMIAVARPDDEGCTADSVGRAPSRACYRRRRRRDVSSSAWTAVGLPGDRTATSVGIAECDRATAPRCAKLQRSSAATRDRSCVAARRTRWRRRRRRASELTPREHRDERRNAAEDLADDPAIELIARRWCWRIASCVSSGRAASVGLACGPTWPMDRCGDRRRRRRDGGSHVWTSIAQRSSCTPDRAQPCRALQSVRARDRAACDSLSIAEKQALLVTVDARSN